MGMGGTNGYMSRATRERHAITWTAKEEAIFELPIGGWATMNAGENLCYFRKKELKFTKYAMKVYEADPLTTLFVKAKVHAFGDAENLFPLPQPDMDMLFPETGKT